ncbi:MAG: hypothetical protein SNI51_09105 [Rikenellaceae bacterium]
MIKTQRVVSMLLLLSIALVIYLFLNNSYLLRIDGAVGVWSAVADQGAWIVPNFVRWFLMVVPIAISAIQYTSEIANKRLKLTLHLPHSETKIVVAMQLFGLVVTVLLYLIVLLPTWVGMLFYYPMEMVNAMLFTLLPYILAGVASYFFVAWVIVEPIWIRRVAHAAISIGALSIFTLESSSLCRYRYAIAQLIVLVVASWIAALYSAARFKDGAQQ